MLEASQGCRGGDAFGLGPYSEAYLKVRCNLFHGQKSAHSEMDRLIVSAAFLTLVHFVKEAGYLQDAF